MVLLIGLALTALPAEAHDLSTQVTVYSADRALIRHLRRVQLPQGESTVTFPGVAATLDLSSVTVRSNTDPSTVTATDIRFHPGITTPENLLSALKGRSVRLLLPDPTTPERSISREAVLLAATTPPIFQMEGGIYLGEHRGIQIPQANSLVLAPTLTWQAKNLGPSHHDMEVLYLAGSMRWSMDYSLYLHHDHTSGELTGQATITNNAGLDLAGAQLRLVAGDVDFNEDNSRKYLAAPSMVREEGPQYHREEIHGGHMYTLPQPVDIAANETVQVPLIATRTIQVEPYLAAASDAMPQRWSGATTTTHPRTMLRLHNCAANGLGIPLPQGTVRVYGKTESGPVLLGESPIGHTPVETEARLRLGESFDVVIERRMLDYQELGRNAARCTWELRIHNAQSTPQRLELSERFHGDWTIQAPSHPFVQKDSRTALLDLTLAPTPKDAPMVVRYTVEARW
ncbi:MAG: DUF4140 domain-containing protein [Desulfomicrobiaceae bacterium]